ncbi:phosphatase [Actinomadura sp. 9N407]|uniref:phosphatase n=1 Tax=Actinomadura sp. 9N407 TaxID=3375154 RepID=UPI00379BE33A
MTAVPERAELREQLVRTMIAGDVATPRQNNLLHFRRMAAGNPYYQFGLDLKPSWTEGEVLAMMVERCGVDPDPMHLYGDDTIDPDITIDSLEEMGDRIGQAARNRERVVLATGHPATLTPVYQAAAEALRASGCQVLTPAAGWSYEVDTGYGFERRKIVYAPGGVAMLEGDEGRTHHTHDPFPMEAMLAELATESKDWPDLAIADHGWAGAAGEAGIDTVGFADCNDPALFAGAAEGKVQVVVPLDDGISPHHYGPMTAYLLHRAGLA